MIDRLSRRAFAVAALASAASLAAPSAAFAEVSAAEYVSRQGNAALAALANRGVTPAARQAQFRALMLQLADMPSISAYVLGPNASRRLRADPALNAEWQAAFIDYCVAVYEDQLDQFRGNEMKVTRSTDRVPGRDVIVETQIIPRGQTRPMLVEWRLVKRGADWKVVDASLVIEDSRIWLAQRQRADFEATLGTRADVPALLALIRRQTATMRTRIAARSARG
ncbi:MAG: ABC transporter substrate-binding protein [Hyphomonadaceae bacterium]|nr:ABC transporter substrate-binding protein [Hyphomonadaceae bacterium]